MKKYSCILLLLLLFLLSSCSLSMEGGESRLFIISIALNYQDTKAPLTYTISDQTAMIDRFIILSENYKKKAVIYQLQENKSNYTISYMDYTDGYIRKDIPRSEPDKLTFDTDIVDIFNLVREDIGKNDTLIFHFSGHGAADDKDIYTGSIMIGTANEGYIYYSLGYLSRLLDSVDCNKVVIFDSCFSGKLLEEDQFVPANYGEKALSKFFEDLSKNPRTWALLASAGDESSYESPTLGHGFFTYSLIKVLGQYTDSEYTVERITASSLFSEAKDALNELWREGNYGKQLQHPTSTANVYDLVLFY